jgi:hypothetical protein
MLSVHDGRDASQSSGKRSIEMSECVVCMNDVELTISKDVRETPQSSELAGHNVGDALNMMALRSQFLSRDAHSVKSDEACLKTLAVAILSKLNEQPFESAGQETHTDMADAQLLCGISRRLSRRTNRYIGTIRFECSGGRHGTSFRSRRFVTAE